MDTVVISSTNHKGGVGKTSCSLELACGLARSGYRVLAIDPDPQGNLTDSLGADILSLIESQKTLYDALYGFKKIDHCIWPTGEANLSLLASDNRLNEKIQEQEAQMGMFIYPYRKLVKELKEQRAWDFIIFDTRPSIGSENLQIFIASDFVIIPTTTGARSTSGISRILDSVERCNEAVRDCDIKLLGILINQVNAQTNVAKQVIPALREKYGSLVFNTTIPIDESVKQAEQLCIPVSRWKPEGKAAAAFKAFTKEVLERLG